MFEAMGYVAYAAALIYVAGYLYSVKEHRRETYSWSSSLRGAVTWPKDFWKSVR